MTIQIWIDIKLQWTHICVLCYHLIRKHCNFVNTLTHLYLIWHINDLLKWVNISSGTFSVQHQSITINNAELLAIGLLETSHWYINSLWPGDAIWWHGTRLTLDQVMACCLIATSHYLNQCWLIISEDPWHSSQGIIHRWSEDTNQWNEIENFSFQMASKSPRGQWVKPKYWKLHSQKCIKWCLLQNAIYLVHASMC